MSNGDLTPFIAPSHNLTLTIVRMNLIVLSWLDPVFRKVTHKSYYSISVHDMLPFDFQGKQAGDKVSILLNAASP
jgi:hypothetical protein